MVRRRGHDRNLRGSPKIFFWGGQMTWASVLRGESETEEEFLDHLSEEWLAVERDERVWRGWSVEQDSHFEEHVTLQVPCFAVTCTVSPVCIHSPVSPVPAPRSCQARVSIHGTKPPVTIPWHEASSDVLQSEARCEGPQSGVGDEVPRTRGATKVG